MKLLNISDSIDLIIGFTFAMFLISIKNENLNNKLKKKIYLFSQKLSDISYSLYVFHFPIVMLIFSLFYSNDQIIFNLSGIIQYLIWMILIIMFSYLMWFVFEKNTYKVRNFINVKLNNW